MQRSQRSFRSGLVLSVSLIGLWSSCLPHVLHAAAGTEAASFLDIPVGAQPGALGSAYTASAINAYAPIWNPAALPLLPAKEATGMHLIYLDSIHYEFASFAMPLGKAADTELPTKRGLGVAIQYLGASHIGGRDDQGNAIGSVNASNAAYTVAYGQRLNSQLSVGGAAKLITESIADASGKAYAADASLLWAFHSDWRLGAALSNWGTPLKLVEQKDPLPANGRLGVAWVQREDLDWNAESVYHRNGLWDAHFGGEWRYGSLFAVRGGYSTAHTKGLSEASGFTGGFGLFWLGQEFAYAWIPYGPLGSTHYFSLSFRFQKPDAIAPAEESMEPSQQLQPKRQIAKPKTRDEWDNIYDLLSDKERKAVETPGQ